MTSHQEPAPGAKSAKFVQANPLDPMIRPFESGGNSVSLSYLLCDALYICSPHLSHVFLHNTQEQEDIQREVAKNVNDRLEKAMDELKEKHRRGTNEVDNPDRAPTGLPYQRMMRQQQHQQQQQQQQTPHVDQIRRQVAEKLSLNNNPDDDSDDDDSDYDDLLQDDDPVLEELRQRRMEELKQAQQKRAQHLALGHGQYRQINQDEFLPECTGSSEFVAVHFFHKAFERCKIMEHHLKRIAPHHVECKFLCIDVEKAPFFVEKLQIRTLPTLIVFRGGKAVQRLTGFEGLQVTPDDPDTWKTENLQEWLAQTGAIDFKPRRRLEEERRPRQTVHRGADKYDEDS